MPFIGKNPTAGFSSIVKDDFTPNGADTPFTLSKQVANANDIAVFVGNVRQEPTTAYTVNGTTLDFGSGNAPAIGLDMYVLHIAGTLESSVIPADGTISSAKIVAGAVTDAKISGMAASKLTGALPAIDGASLTNLVNVNSHYAFRGLDSQYFTSSNTVMNFYSSGDNFSSGITIDESNDRFTPTVAGKYLVMYHIGASHSGGTFTLSSSIRKNGSTKYPNNTLINYSGGFNEAMFGQAVVDMNGSSDYVDLIASHNGGGNATSGTNGYFFMVHINAS